MTAGVLAIITPKIADASAASKSMQHFVGPLFATMVALASLVSVFFLINGAVNYMTSAGHPDKLEHAKKVIRNALLGLVLVIAAGTITAILTNAYHGDANGKVDKLPSLIAVQPAPTDSGLVDVLIKAINGLFLHIIQSAAGPFIKALDYFTHATPLMVENPSVFSMWLATVAIADSLFVLVVALLGFHVMSSSSLGMEEIEFKHLLPQLAVGFLLINSSIFLIDIAISISNAMISALFAAFPDMSVWKALSDVVKQSAGAGLVALMIMMVFIILAIILLVYYVTRLVALYLGAVLAPIVMLLWLLPGFKDFVAAATKTYLATIFVLFIHVIILLLAASMFTGMVAATPGKTLDPIMATIVGIATLLALLKTQGLLMQLSYVSIGPRALRKLSSQFVNGLSYTSTKLKTARAVR